ncbi:TM2 domain protein|nr:TM2 domain protein [Candidatus Pantoea persica]
MAALLFACFLGGLGIHKFYLGKAGQGIFYILFCWTFIPSVIVFIEFILYLCSSDEDFVLKYG